MAWWRELVAQGPLPSLTVPVNAPRARVRPLAERPGGTAPPAASHDARPWWPRTVTSTTRAMDLTPGTLGRYLSGALDGDPQAQSELLYELEDRDLHLCAVLGTRAQAVAGLPLRVVAASERARDKRIARWIEQRLPEIDGLRDAFADLARGVYYGFAAAEIDWRVTGGEIRPRKLISRPQHWFRPSRLDPMRWHIQTERNGWEGEPLQAGCWVWFSPRAKSGWSDAGAGLGRPCAWAWVIKSYGIKDWATFSEVYGAPIRVARYAPGTSEEDRRKILEALRQLGTSAAAMLPDSASLEFIATQNARSSVDVYESLIKWAEAAQSKCVLGQTLTTQEGSSGTQALGTVHDQVRRDLTASDASQLSEALSQQLIAPWVRHQFGDVDTPRLILDCTPPEDLATRAELYTALQKLGVALPRAHVHEVFGVPQAGPGEDVLTPPTPPTSEAMPTPPATTPSPAATWLADLGHVNARIGGCVQCGEGGPVDEELERLVREAMARGGAAGWAQLVEVMRAELGKAGRLDAVPARLLAICEQLDLWELAAPLADELLTGELLGRAHVEAGDEPVEFPKVPPKEAIAWWTKKAVVTPEEFDALDSAARTKAFTITKVQSLTALQGAKEALEWALETGATQADFEDRVETEWRGLGLSPKAPHRMALVFHNNISTAYHVGRWNRQDRDTERQYLQYLAVQDWLTRPAHDKMHGRVWPRAHPIWRVWYPLNGHGCRCRVRSLTAAEVAALGIKVEDELPVIDVAREDGSRVRAPLVPELGFQTNPALEPHEFDLSRFPADWVAALNRGGGES